MLSKERIVTSLNAVADQVEALCSEHEAESHDGVMCMSNRLSALAFMAHRLGIKEDWSAVAPGTGILVTADEAFWCLVADYEKNCPHCKEKREATS